MRPHLSPYNRPSRIERKFGLSRPIFICISELSLYKNWKMVERGLLFVCFLCPTLLNSLQNIILLRAFSLSDRQKSDFINNQL